MSFHHRSGGGSFHEVLDYEYTTGNLIGHGAFALVFKGRRKQTLEIVAIKQISLKSVPGRLSTIRQKEIAILKEVKHSNVVRLYDYHEDQFHIYLVMEYCNGGDLGDYLQAKRTLSEHSIRHLTIHISNALGSLHQLHIIHRDIKPQNLLLTYPLITGNGAVGKTDRPITDAIIKLADFGFARYLTGTDMAATLCGSPLYMAPEILLGEKYDSKADLWSVGTILYQCLAGNAPFLANNPHALKKRYEREKLVAKIPEGTSRYLTSLLTKLLRKNRHERLSHEELCQHPFLADPSIQASGYLVMSPSPPRAKSSPVPIKRHSPSPSPSPYSNHHSRSPHQNPYDMFVSPSSGPPSIHPIGSASSLARQQSPHSDVTDHGFVLVDSPHHRTSPPYSSANSSTHSGSYGSCRSHTPSSTGHTPSSSYGSSSMHKFRSLTTPFYQAPPTSQSSNGIIPSVKASSVIANSPPTQCEHQRPRFHSNSFKRRLSDPFSTAGGGSTPLSHHHTQSPPFGKLIQLASGANHPTPSPYTSPYGTLSPSPSPSPYTHSPSPHPPPVNPTPTTAAAAAVTLGSRHSTRSGMRYSLSAHGSGSKLSSLVEQGEQQPIHKQQKNSSREERRSKNISSNKRDIPSSSRQSEDRGHVDELITMSQVLQSDDEEEEDVDFPLSLSLHSSMSSNKTEEQETEDVTDEGEAEEGQWGSADVTTPTCKTKFALNRNRGDSRRCKSAVVGSQRDRHTISRQHSEQLMENFQQIKNRAASLSAHQSMLAESYDSNHFTSSTALNQYEFQVSPAAEIKPVTPTFQLPLPSPPTNKMAPQSQPRLSNSREPGENYNSRGSSVVTTKDATHQRGKGEEEKEGMKSCLVPIKQAMMLARELNGMAQARQGPIMLLSTDLSASGGVSRVQRYSEQLVLYAKAVSVLDSGLRQFQIEMATSSMELDQTQIHTAEVEAEEMYELCLEKARQVREEMKKSSFHFSHPLSYHSSQLSAEKLLLVEALDMCKQAVLNEQSGDSKECVKRYRIAKLIFSHLLSDAKTHQDRAVLNKYIYSITRRIQRLTSDY